HRVSAEGELIQTEEITVPSGTMMHDFNITENYVIWMDLPALWDLDNMGSGLPLKFDRSYGARLGVMPRAGCSDDVVWYDIDPCYAFHPLNAYEEGETIVIDVCRKADMDAAAMLHRWVIDKAAGSVTEIPLDDRSIEFPRVCDSKVGVKHRYGYLAGLAGLVPYAERYIKYDFDSMSSVVAELGEGREGSEAVFVKNPDGKTEDDGWLLAYVYDDATQASEVIILDAATMSAEPLARIMLPTRVPMGFHGSWVPF
ncbi:MAG: carotenoid oxygenase family protein, partial [Pseudomonadales bacterium]